MYYLIQEMKKPTKERILDAALKLFNQDGIVNVRLQHIADEAAISVGNLAYHYSNKAAIANALYDRLDKAQQSLLKEYQVVPLFENIDRLIQHTYQLQKDYRYFYLDTLEIIRAYPEVGLAFRKQAKITILQIRQILDFNVSRGVLIEEPVKGFYAELADHIWMALDFGFYQHLVRQEELPGWATYRRRIWYLIIPLFTNTGKMEYTQMLDNPYELYFS